MNDEPQHKHRKYFILALFAVFIAIIGVILPEPDEVAFEFVKNNTNLAPTIDVDHPGTGERVSGVTYWANNSALYIMAFAHANKTSQTAQVALFVDGTLVLPQSGRPLGGAEEANRSISGIIPKGSNYTYVFTNYHHYEIREWKILSGRNGTLSINQTIINNIGGGVSFNGNPINLNGSLLFNGTFNGSYDHDKLYNASLSSHNITQNQNMQGRRLQNSSYLELQSSIWENSSSTLTGFSIKNTAAGFINGLFVGSVGNINFGSNYDPRPDGVGNVCAASSSANCSSTNTTLNSWIDRWGSAAAQAFKRKIIIVYPGTNTETDVITIDMSYGVNLTTFSNTNITLTKMAGAGNAYACFDANGQLYRGNPGC